MVSESRNNIYLTLGDVAPGGLRCVLRAVDLDKEREVMESLFPEATVLDLAYVMELRERAKSENIDTEIEPLLGSVRDKALLKSTLKASSVTTVLHAAAY